MTRVRWLAPLVVAATAILLSLPAAGSSDSTYKFSFSVAFGDGSITVQPGSIVCPPTCSVELTPGEDILVTAKAASHYYLQTADLTNAYAQLQIAAGPSVFIHAALSSWTSYIAYSVPITKGVKQITTFPPPTVDQSLTADTFMAGHVVLRWEGADAVVRRSTGTSCPKSILDGTYLGYGAPPSGLDAPGYLDDSSVTPGQAYCYAVFSLTDPAKGVSLGVVAPPTTMTPGPPTVTSMKPATGDVGTIVQIKGMNLLETTSVLFGNDPAHSFWPVSSSVLDAIVPPGTRHSAAITVNTASGSATTATAFVVPIATVTSFAPTSGHVGDWVTIKGTRFDLRPTVYFGAGAAYQQYISPTQLRAQVPIDATSGPITVGSPAGSAQSAGSFTVLP